MPIAHSFEEFVPYDLKTVERPASFLKSLIVPRPIAFITSVNKEGVVNAAPFSYFNVVCSNPALLSIAIQRRDKMPKDTARNIMEQKEFVVNICSVDLAEIVSVASGDFPPHVSEVEHTKLSLIPSEKISVPRIANTLAQMECVLDRVIEVGKKKADLVLGEIVKMHVHRTVLKDHDAIEVKKLNPLARLEGASYACVNDSFEIKQ